MAALVTPARGVSGPVEPPDDDHVNNAAARSIKQFGGVRDQEAGGSNPLAPTITYRLFGNSKTAPINRLLNFRQLVGFGT